MKNALIAALALSLLGCVEAGEEEECYLPGDQDCQGGKGDAWDERNDPDRMLGDLNYVLAELPLRGAAEQTIWAGSYWPTRQGSANYRWQGRHVLSPTEKYDQAFRGWSPSPDYLNYVPAVCGPAAHEEYTAYLQTLGPAAEWQAQFQKRSFLFDDQDNNGNGQVDECWEHGYYDELGDWWGMCNAWCSAAILEPEPLHAVERNGIRFEVSDIKALLTAIYMKVNSHSLGGYCHAQTLSRDESGRITRDECRDTNPGSWHVIATNFLGRKQTPFVMDVEAGWHVWNQPVVGYTINRQEEISEGEANSLLDVDRADPYPFNHRAEKLYRVAMCADWLAESEPSRSPVGMAGHVKQSCYDYILEVDGAGKVIGGEWLWQSQTEHPDFLWHPTQAVPVTVSEARDYWTANPYLDLTTVRSLLEESRQ